MSFMVLAVVGVVTWFAVSCVAASVIGRSFASREAVLAEAAWLEPADSVLVGDLIL